MLIVGIDWATRKHQIIFMDEMGNTLREFSIDHDGDGLQTLVQAMGDYAEPEDVRIAIEHHQGALIDCLAQAGYSIYAMNPKSADRARDRYRPAGGKDDRIDAFVLADTLRLDGGRLRPYAPPSPQTHLIGRLHAERHGLVQDRSRLIQQLRAILLDSSPSVNALLDDLSRVRWQRRLLAQYPTHQALAQAHANSLHAFCRKHRLQQSRRDRILAVARSAPLPLPAAQWQAPSGQIRRLIARIDLLDDQLAELQDQLSEAIAAHPLGELMASLPSGGVVTQSGLLSIFGDSAADRTWRQQASACGVSPVTFQSGKIRLAKRRKACQTRHRQTLLHLAYHTAFRVDGCWARHYYQAKRQAGVRHSTILRCLAQRWTKIIHAMLKHNRPYDENHHQTNRNQAAA